MKKNKPPPPPSPPLSRSTTMGVGVFCPNCNSTMSKSGFMGWFGKRYCDNEECPNSKKTSKMIGLQSNKRYFELLEYFSIKR